MTLLLNHSVSYFFYFLTALVLCSASQPVVQIAQGVVHGLYMKTINNREISAFLGIPYGKPPIGKHRFKEPVPAKSWLGIYNATTTPNSCLQYSHVYYKTYHAIYGSEDCLYVNVYTPKLFNHAKDPALMDVLVFIHAGAFMYLSSAYYQPDFLLDKDVVMVTFNYRLGILGFLSTEDNIIPGNNGMKDQVLALKWIKNNIAAFGGNPNNIIISGNSAGGASVHYHLLSPLSKGLFDKAIILGGSALNPWSQMENPKEKSMKVASNVGCPTNDSLLMLKCLRDRPGIQIVASTTLFLPWLYNPFSPFSITIEPSDPSAFISEKPIDIITQKKATDVPILFSMNADEGLYPGAEILSDPKIIEEIDVRWNELLPYLLDYNYTAPFGHKDVISQKIRDFYLREDTVNDEKPKFVRMLSDRLFNAGIIKMGRLHTEHYSSPVYSYLFSHKGSIRLSDLFNMPPTVYDGTSHADDVGYVIKATYLPIENNATDMLLSKRMVDYWLTFMKGAPMPKQWPTIRMNLPNFGFLDIQNENEINDIVRVESDFGNEKFWDSLNLNENVPSIVRWKEEL